MTNPVGSDPKPPPQPATEEQRRATVVRRRKYSKTMTKEQLESALKAEEAKKEQKK